MIPEAPPSLTAFISSGSSCLDTLAPDARTIAEGLILALRTALPSRCHLTWWAEVIFSSGGGALVRVRSGNNLNGDYALQDMVHWSRCEHSRRKISDFERMPPFSQIECVLLLQP
jgi:hypothetical protein